MLVILGWNKLIVQWCKYYRPRDSIRALVLHVYLATLYSLLFAACNGCIFMPSRTLSGKSGSSWRILCFFAAEMRRSTRVMVG